MTPPPDTKTLLEWSAKYHTPNYGRTPILLVRSPQATVRTSRRAFVRAL